LFTTKSVSRTLNSFRIFSGIEDNVGEVGGKCWRPL
jgi:hypothetical protein